MRARRAVALAPRSLTWEEVDLPDAPPPGKLLVRAHTTLISTGTELANWTGITADRAAMGADWRQQPFRPGYSLAGSVLAVGDSVDSWTVGDRLSAAGPHASAAVLDAARCVKVPPTVSDEAAAFGTLGAIALNGVRRAGIGLGDRIAVVGLGLIGELAGLLARLNGARPVVGLDLVPNRCDLAVALGWDAALDPDDPSSIHEASATWTDGAGFDIVIEATGHPAAFAPALRLVRREGKVVALGSTRGLLADFDLYDMIHRPGVTLIGAHANTHPLTATAANPWTEPANRSLIVRLVASGDLPVERLISHREPAARAPELFALLADRRQEAMGVVLDWLA